MGWLHSLSLLSVLFACSFVTAEYSYPNYPPSQRQTSYPTSKTNTYWHRYVCRESNPSYQCIFRDVSIDRNTPGAYFGDVEITHNSQKNITFKNSFMRKLPETLLNSFREVELLELSGLQLEEIAPNAFAYGNHIRELYMGYNNIRVLPQGVFQNMRALELLGLDRNLLEHLPWNIFADTSNLIGLSIVNNILQRIGDNTFKNVKKLENLELSSNNLTYIDLSLIPSLKYGNVSSNLLTTLAIPVAVAELDASHNRIATVTGPNNTELESLFLHHNNLTNIAWLGRYSGLIVLDLSYNEIEKVTDNHFKKSYRLEKLYLSNNRLVALNLNSAPIGTLKILDVRHNHLLHVERNVNQFNTLEELYLDHNAIVTLKLRPNNALQNLTLSHNDWDCKNLDELFQSVSESVINDRDRSCKADYQLKQGICCKESDKPQLDRLLMQISLTIDAEKQQRAEGCCSASDIINSVRKLTDFITQEGILVQSNPQLQTEINLLKADVQLLTYLQSQHEQLLELLHTGVDNAVRRYRVIKLGLYLNI
ncbi:leucine-rich repeat-containing protein 15-like [Anopheles moucheti]|uniref:leucine-rich repeat-containing protein 15-like n=1 Tax=Anopheles moucheti TaxID=186751 RepID=UPI0022F067D5|nr:leucine-rich repeat-containing protein 15-like [Anopheles moucheti]